jgi:hypothetical protein
MALPLCPIVLSLLAAEPRELGGVARELARRGLSEEQPAHEAATVTVTRLRSAGLVYTRGARLRITAHGRRELALRRALSRRTGRRW